MAMETRVVKTRVTLRLNEKLLLRLREKADKANMSLNDYVEGILLDSVYTEPNEDTIEAINEARSGKYAGVVNTSSAEAFWKSLEE